MIGDIEERKRVLRELFAMADYRITASRFVRGIFLQNGFDQSMQLQPYGHDIAWLDHYLGKSPAERLCIGFVGQIIEHKGVHLLLQAIALLQASYGKQIQVLIYGDLKNQSSMVSILQAWPPRWRTSILAAPTATIRAAQSLQRLMCRWCPRCGMTFP